ncbi:MBL fold metallo-hydrolase [Brevibacillus sp. SYP-B805]|uniref:MBL fold metallo-hydrolase n=1 Tax=Brevibacillus sp. SYP-B805 TaxID=1578199 RepID=UPI0013EA8756|nr:MBL fold metallo-hydrolase [Brevibacillus sp. SYP-B805]NGQ94951.1 MBL fold metallo-hydrolase [Brevibacillus sp. SYP-B805]
MILQKLPWACILLQTEKTTLLIDPLGETTSPGNPAGAWMGAPGEPIVPLSDVPGVAGVLITHVHPDHFDPAAILGAYGADIPLLLPEESADVARKAGFRHVRGMSVGGVYRIGEAAITATYAVDGFGTPQVAWIVEGNGKKVIHCGDTLWHGYWWKIARLYGPFHAACLPVNGPILEVPGLARQSRVEAAMSPEQAVEAAYLLEADKMVPMHYGTFHNPPCYRETDNVVERVLARAQERSLDVRIMKTGERLIL